MNTDAVPPIPEESSDYVRIERAFDAPRERFWQFWTDADLLSQWFGPHAVHVDRESTKVEPVVGGAWVVTMVDNESDERYPVEAEIIAIAPPVYLHGGESSEFAGSGDSPTLSLQVWLEPSEDGESTELTIHQGPFIPEYLEMTRDGWLESFVKIDAGIAGGVVGGVAGGVA